MTPQQARACVYLAAASTALAFGCLVLLIVLAVQRDAARAEVNALTRWSVAIYERLNATGCVGGDLPKIPLHHKER